MWGSVLARRSRRRALRAPQGAEGGVGGVASAAGGGAAALAAVGGADGAAALAAVGRAVATLAAAAASGGAGAAFAAGAGAAFGSDFDAACDNGRSWAGLFSAWAPREAASLAPRWSAPWVASCAPPPAEEKSPPTGVGLLSPRALEEALAGCRRLQDAADRFQPMVPIFQATKEKLLCLADPAADDSDGLRESKADLREAVERLAAETHDDRVDVSRTPRAAVNRVALAAHQLRRWALEATEEAAGNGAVADGAGAHAAYADGGLADGGFADGGVAFPFFPKHA